MNGIQCGGLGVRFKRVPPFLQPLITPLPGQPHLGMSSEWRFNAGPASQTPAQH